MKADVLRRISAALSRLGNVEKALKLIENAKVLNQPAIEKVFCFDVINAFRRMGC
jgi:hypothetical protein